MVIDSGFTEFTDNIQIDNCVRDANLKLEFAKYGITINFED